MALLPPASNIVITGGSFVHNQNHDVTKDPLTPLYDKVAPNAILNSGGRADPVRCHPGTREEVIAKIEKRITRNNTGDRGVFWLSGPAGAGKSAIMQTVAERCAERQIPMINFFFFRADGTRNHSDPIVATILFQLFDLFPALKARVAAIASHNPVIFRQSMRDQFVALIEAPLQSIVPSSENNPLVILIDGLDECSSGNGKDDQVLLLNILHDMATRSISPGFIVLVASRTEAHLTKAFNKIGCHPESIYLDESYRPSDDIRIFITHEFSEIKQTHGLRDSLPEDWPPSSDIDAIVEKSSGQFVYPATVARFIADSPASPTRSLEIVLGLRPPMRTSPFAALDSLYMYILSQAEDWNSVRDILASQNILTIMSKHYFSLQLTTILSPLGYTKDDILSSLSDLTAIVKFRARARQLTIYHASLNDFLFDKARAGDFYIDVNAFACRLAPFHFRRSATSMDLLYSFNILQAVTEPDEQLTNFLNLFLPDHEFFRQKDLSSTFQDDWMNILGRLYQSCNRAVHRNIRKRWKEWFIVNRSPGASVNRSTSEQRMLPQTVPSQSSPCPSILLLPEHELPEPSTNSDIARKLSPVQTVPSQASPSEFTAPLQRDLLEPSTDGDVAGESSPVQTVSSQLSPGPSTEPLQHELSEPSSLVQDVMTERVQDCDLVGEAEMQDQGTKVLWWFLILFLSYVHAGFVSK